MSDEKPYTEEEFYEDCRAWGRATKKQREEAFNALFTATGAVAVNRQNPHLIKTLRELREGLS